MRDLIGTHDVLLITLDTLRFDVAQAEFKAGRTPHLGSLLGPGGWERRHTPGSFTYAAHHAFFAGFLPTPVRERRQARLYAARFDGSETIGKRTWVFDAADLPTALADAGYRTLCIGGVGFFNKRTALGRALPSLFQESLWDPSMGVAGRRSTAIQVAAGIAWLQRCASTQRSFIFLNVSALHRPNRIFTRGAQRDTLETHAQALRYVDRSLAPLLAAMRERAPTFFIACSDHGTAYGEGGYDGHRVAHPVVWTVPYADGILKGAA